MHAHSYTATKHTEEIPPPKPWGGPGADQASCEPVVVLAHQASKHVVTAHRKFRIILQLWCTDARINGLSNLVCMFIGRVAHQLFQIVDSVSQCSMLLQRALGNKGQTKRLNDAEFEKFEARVKAFGSPGLSKKLWWFPSFWWACSTWLFTWCHTKISFL